jgi:hypothetical protein
VLDNLAEKMDKCPAVELGVPRYPPKKKWDMIKIWWKKKMIAHGPSNKQYASKSDKFLIFKIFDLRVWHSSPRIPFWPFNKYKVCMLKELFLQNQNSLSEIYI